jgi:hypothetical protein
VPPERGLEAAPWRCSSRPVRAGAIALLSFVLERMPGRKGGEALVGRERDGAI